MADDDQSWQLPNPQGLPPVQSVEFIRALRTLLADESRWGNDEYGQRSRTYWFELLSDDTQRVEDSDEVRRDTELADLWFQRLFVEGEGATYFHLDNPEAWNHPAFQEFLGRWWHPGTRLPILAPLSSTQVWSTSTTFVSCITQRQFADTSKGPNTSNEDDPLAGDVASSGDVGGDGNTAPNDPDQPATEPSQGPTPGHERDSSGNQEGDNTHEPPRNSPSRQPPDLPHTPAGPPAGGNLPTPPNTTGAARSAGGGSGVRRLLFSTRAPPESPTTSRPGRARPPTSVPNQPTGNVTQPVQPNLPDMMRPHTWRDQRQPPIGARLLQILNWVNDEDIDRRRDWSRELEEAEAWVQEQLDRRDENGLGDDTIALLRQAEAAMKTHRRNERYHYRTFMDLTIPKPDELPKYAPRLPYNSKDPIELGVTGPVARTTQILPQFPEVPRPWRAVNDMWLTEREGALPLRDTLPEARAHGLLELAGAESRLWAPQADQAPQTADNNLLLVENAAYSTAAHNDDVVASTRGWVYWTDNPVPPQETRSLADGTQLRSNTRDFALERGARRAGLQTALRQFHSSENHLIANNGRMLVLPGGTTAEANPDLEEVKNKAGIGSSRPIELTELPANQMQRIDGKTDPQGFNANMAQYLSKAHESMAAARRHAIAKSFRHSPDGAMYADQRDEHKPLTPKSRFGPFVWRGVTAKVQVRQDCLRQMRGLKKLFDRERQIAPRQLLADIQEAYQHGYDLQDAPDNLLRLVDGRDWADDPDDGRTPRYLNQVELEWIRFLLNHSMTDGMTNPALPRTAIFLNFAQRLERIFNDPGDSLFPDADTSVTIEDLIAHMDSMKGPVKKTTFYPYDVKMFLERLAFQGRCRYVEDWRTYGRVQRPVLKYFPEDLIMWRTQDNDSGDPNNHPEGIRPDTPRFEDLRTWHDIVHQDPPEAVDANVRQFILCLAYRWGHGTRRLAAQEENWKLIAPVPLPLFDSELGRLSNKFDLQMGSDEEARRVEDDMSLIWKVTLNKTEEQPPQDITVIKEIRRGVINEIVRADNMLYPGRSTNYLQADAPKTRESIWDWAKPEVRGKSKKFFSLNRWPVQLQSAETQHRIKDDVDVDPDMLWNPIIEDPTPWTYYRPKAKPYGQDTVKFRTGRRLYPIGDTARQREVVKNQVMAMVGSGKISLSTKSIFRNWSLFADCEPSRSDGGIARQQCRR